MRSPSWTIPLDATSTRVLRAGIEPPAPAAHGWVDPDGRTRSLIERHRLHGLLVHAVATGGLVASTEQSREAAELELELTRSRLWHDMRLVQITALLTESLIEHRVLKGPAFGSLDYPDRIMRPTGDIDLLVRGADLPAAVSVLCRIGGRVVDPEPVAGYSQRIGKSTTITMPDGLEIDLHRTLTRGPFGLRVEIDDLWSRSRSFDVGGTELRTLGLEESLLHACFHLMVLSEKRALSARDVAQFLARSDLDAERTIELATRWKSRIVLAAAVLLVTDMIPAAGRTPLLEWAQTFRPGLLERCYLRIAQPEHPIGPAEWPATFLELHSASARWMLIRSIIRPIPGTNPPISQRISGLMARRRRRQRRVARP